MPAQVGTSKFLSHNGYGNIMSIWQRLLNEMNNIVHEWSWSSGMMVVLHEFQVNQAKLNFIVELVKQIILHGFNIAIQNFLSYNIKWRSIWFCGCSYDCSYFHGNQNIKWNYVNRFCCLLHIFYVHYIDEREKSEPERLPFKSIFQCEKLTKGKKSVENTMIICKVQLLYVGIRLFLFAHLNKTWGVPKNI